MAVITELEGAQALEALKANPDFFSAAGKAGAGKAGAAKGATAKGAAASVRSFHARLCRWLQHH